MTTGKNKFLVNLLHGLDAKQLVFGVWFVIVAIFVLLIMAYYRRNTRSNFRRPEDGPGPHIDVHARRLDSGNAHTQVAVRGSKDHGVKKG